MKKVAFTGCSQALIKQLILHFMKVKNGSFKITPWDDAEIVVFGGEPRIENSDYPTGGKLWVITAGENRHIVGNVITLPAPTWDSSLLCCLEDLVLNRIDDLRQEYAPAHTDDNPSTQTLLIAFTSNQAESIASRDHIAESDDNHLAGKSVDADSSLGAVEVKINCPEYPPILDSSNAPYPTPETESTGIAAGSDSVDDVNREQVFDPQDYPILEILHDSFSKNMVIEFDQQRSITIIDGKCLLNISRNSLKALCTQKDARHWNIKVIKPSKILRFPGEKVSTDNLETVSLDRFLWDICHLISVGRRSLTLDTTTQCSLSHYPDFNRIEARDSYIRMAAMLSRQPTTAEDLSTQSESPIKEVNDFLFALQTGRYLGDAKRQGINAKDANTGVIRKLMSKFSRSGTVDVSS